MSETETVLCTEHMVVNAEVLCTLPRGHKGWHLDLSGARWRDGQPTRLWDGPWHRWGTLAMVLLCAALTVGYAIAGDDKWGISLSATAGWWGRYALMADRGWREVSQ